MLRIMRKLWIVLAFSAVCLAVCSVVVAVETSDQNSSAKERSAETIDFAHDIRPILAERCYACHASKRSEGGLRWDRKKSALAGGDSGEPAIVPGKPELSHAIKLVRGEEGEIMPPEDEGEPLAEEQIALLIRWIQNGAVWPDDADAVADQPAHWAWISAKRRPLPVVKHAVWPRHGMDTWAVARMEQAGLSPSPEADRYTLVRRVYLDLIGLPPTPAEVQAFISDESSRAYEKMVDRVLTSPRYGERWARVWLDLARYADSQG